MGAMPMTLQIAASATNTVAAFALMGSPAKR